MRWLPLALILALVGIATLVAAEELTIDPESYSRTVRPGESLTIYYSFEYTNGTPSETVQINLTVWDMDWTHELSAWVNGTLVTHPSMLELPVTNNSMGNFTVKIDVARTAPASTYIFHLQINLKERPSVYSTAWLHFWISYAPGVALNLTDPAQDGARVRPGELIELGFELTNLGNRRDQFQLDVRATGPGSGWRTFFSEGVGDAQWTPWVSPGKVHPLTFVVLVPYSAMAYEHIELAFIVSSMADPTFTATPLCVTVLCAFMGQIEVLNSSFSSDSLDPASSVGGLMTMECTVSVRNLGNGDDLVYAEGHITGLEEAGFAAVRVPRNPLPIDAGDARDFILELVVESNAPAGIYLTWFSFTSSDLSASDMLETMIPVKSSKAVMVECPAPVLAARPTDTVEFELRFRNMGNTDVTFSLSVETNLTKWYMRFTPPSVNLPYGTEQVVYLSVQVPRLTGTVLPTSYPFTVVAKGPVGTRMASCDLTVELPPIRRVEWAVDGIPVTAWDSVLAGDKAIYPRPAINPFHANGTWASDMLSVVNLGNAEASVSLIPRIIPEGVEVSFEPSNVTVAPGEDVAVVVRVRVAWDVAPGPYILSATMACVEDPDFRARVLPIGFSVFNIDVEVVAPIPVMFDLLWTSTPTISGMDMYDTLDIMGTVRNLCEFDVGQVQVSLLHIAPDGVQEVLSYRYAGLPARGSAVCNFSWIADAPGEHQLGVVVDLGGQSRSDNDAAWVTVNVEGGLVDEDGASHPAALREPVAMATAAVGAVIAFLALRLWTATRRRTGREGARHYRMLRKG